MYANLFKKELHPLISLSCRLLRLKQTAGHSSGHLLLDLFRFAPARVHRVARLKHKGEPPRLMLIWRQIKTSYKHKVQTWKDKNIQRARADPRAGRKAVAAARERLDAGSLSGGVRLKAFGGGQHRPNFSHKVLRGERTFERVHQSVRYKSRTNHSVSTAQKTNIWIYKNLGDLKFRLWLMALYLWKSQLLNLDRNAC